MAGFLLIETQHGATADRFLADALALAGAGTPVTVFLASDGAAGAVRGASPALDGVLAAGGRVWVDGFTLAQRAMTAAPLATGVAVADMRQVAELVTAAGTTVVWH